MSQALWAMVNQFHNIGGPDVIGFPPLGKGRKYYVDGANGDDALAGDRPDRPKLTLGAAFDRCIAGQNDAVVIIGNGVAGGSVRIGSKFTWNKNATHLFGITAPTGISPRARLATTGSDTAFAEFFEITADGCMFSNFQLWHGFDTGTTSAICLEVSGRRNYFEDLHIAGMGDAASAQDAGSRSLKIGGSGRGENLFNRCTIGVDTVTRTVANASLEFTGGTPRNKFVDCVFPFRGSASTPLGIIGSAANFMDRWNLFERCSFINTISTGSTTMAVLATLNASPNGMLIFKDCMRIGITVLATDGAGAENMFAVYGGVAPSSPDALGLALSADT